LGKDELWDDRSNVAVGDDDRTGMGMDVYRREIGAFEPGRKTSGNQVGGVGRVFSERLMLPY